MGLKKYQAKRNFLKTPEPEGAPSKRSGKLRFVVQKHAAHRLHYDFRLELDGVLVSWAVPKGPSLNPADKRLAVAVEDHPFAYRSFEGIIPEGNYGAGTVMVWDEGTYRDSRFKTASESEAALRKGLKTGHLHLELSGKKLKGAFSLVKMHGRGDSTWLLLKKEDRFASKTDVLAKDRSAVSRRGLPAIAKQAKSKHAVWQSPKREEPKEKVSKKAKKVSFPPPHDLVKPMLATLVKEPFDRKDWIYEIKWDGYRAIAEITKRGVFLYSRNHKDFSAKFEPVFDDLTKVKRPMILDGEIVAVDSEGKASFQNLQAFEKTGRGNLLYYIFDLLSLNGKDLRSESLLHRKGRLAKSLPKLPHLRISDHIEEGGKEFFELMTQQSIEGMVAKNGVSSYQEGHRSSDWLKVKTHSEQEAVICGFTAPKGSRKFFGALILGVYEGKNLVYIGHTGTGFPDLLLSDLHQKMEKLKTSRCPFAVPPKTNDEPTWLKPKLVCEVAFHEWTEDGRLRQPVFVGLRIDKAASSVRREKAVVLASREQKRPASKKNKAEVKLTHLSKIYWPQDKLTKGNLIEYYREIAPIILPYLKDRPQSLRRNPNGIKGHSFFQKDITSDLPGFAETVPIHSDSGDKEIHYLVCQNVETLLYMANLGCIEINPWNSRVGHLQNPDYLVIDLDPEAIAFSKVVETALEVRKLLDELELESFCKTSGATGLHVYLPLGAKYDYETAKNFAEVLANLVQSKLPKTTSVIRSPAQRQRKVYLDFLQNRYGQTLASAYSVRPRPGSTVSTPLHWSEVTPKLDPTQFTLKTIFKRLEKHGDLFLPVLKRKVNLKTAFSRLEKLSS